MPTSPCTKRKHAARRVLLCLTRACKRRFRIVFSSKTICGQPSDWDVGCGMWDVGCGMWDVGCAVGHDTSDIRHPTSDINAGNATVGTDQFLLVYQPIVSLEDGELRGAEALVRWDHPTRGLVSPGEFIPIAEETRLILPLSNWIFEQACAQFMKWRQQAPDRAPAYISINLSRIHLAEQDLVEQIIRTVQRAGMEPGQLQLEMTESGILRDRQAAKKILRALKAAGIRLAMDDFGTGQSSLSCLHELPFDVLKIDRLSSVLSEGGSSSPWPARSSRLPRIWA